MTTTAPAFGREAFDFIEGVDRLCAPVAVMEAMRCVVAQFGFEWFVFTGLVPQPGQAFDDLLLSGLFPDGFRAVYADRDYGRSDPNVRRALHSSHPFEWTWTDYDEEDGPRAAEIMRIFADFRMPGGFIVPVHSAGGYEAGVAMAGANVDLIAEAKPALHLMALYAFERVRNLVAATPARKPPLTNREREVLAWSAQGKSAWEIGEILCVAKRTVDEHARSAMRKLGAVNRTQAVAIAIRHRLFEV
jgi:LuxR family transcriptional regulator, quorum-sensing system regulator BjaR1